MDLALYGIGLFTPTILSIIDLGGENPAGIQVWLARDVRATEGALVLDLFLVMGFCIALLTIDHGGRLLLQRIGFLGMGAGLLISLNHCDVGPETRNSACRMQDLRERLDGVYGAQRPGCGDIQGGRSSSMFGAQATALRSGQVQVSICQGTTPQELEEAINAALLSVSRKSSDPQLLDIRFPQSAFSSLDGGEREYLAVVIWQQS